MAILSRPSTQYPTFATTNITDPTSGQPAILAPGSSVLTDGIGYQQPLDRQAINWHWNLDGQWVRYLDSQINDGADGLEYRAGLTDDFISRLFNITGAETTGVGPLTTEVQTIKSEIAALIPIGKNEYFLGAGTNSYGTAVLPDGFLNLVLAVDIRAVLISSGDIIARGRLWDSHIFGNVPINCAGEWTRDSSGDVAWSTNTQTVGFVTGVVPSNGWNDALIEKTLTVIYL